MMTLDEKLLLKLKELRYNNNKYIQELKQLELDSAMQEEKLKALESEYEELREFYLQVSSTLLDISAELQPANKKSSKSTTTKTALKNDQNKQSKELTLREETLKCKNVITFLFNEYVKNKR